MQTKIRNPLIATAIIIFILFGISFISVKSYYTQGLPYYDSIGAYWNMFSIMNITRSQGFIAGINQATLYPLSWLQSFFAVLAAFFLEKNPQQLIILNFICLFILIFSLHKVTKSLQLSNFQSYLIFLIPLIPASLFWWKGGYIDLRRDASFVTLLAASYFFLSSFLFKPKVSSGLICGIVLGLTQWSRGNALPQIILTALTVYGTYFTDKNIRANWRDVVSKSSFIIFSFATLAIPFYLYNIEIIILQYSNNWAINGDRIRSFIDFLPAGLVFMLGYTSKEIIISFLFFSLILFIFFYLFYKKKVTFNNNIFKQKYSFYFKSGVLLYLLIFFFNVFVVGIMKNLGDHQAYLPFFPLIIGLYSILVFLVASMKFKKAQESHIFKVLLILSMIFIVATTIRIKANKPPTDKQLHDQAKQIVRDIGKDLGGRTVAYLWLEDINVHTLNFYLTQRGFEPIRTSSRISKNVDIENPPVSYISIADQQKEFAEGLRTKDFIVFAQNTSLYENKNAFFSMFVFGKPVLDELLVDDNFAKYHTFTIRDTPFIVLKNQIERK